MKLILRDYQHDTIQANLRLLNSGYYAVLSVLATGLGKTAIMVEHVNSHIDLNTERVLIIAPAHLVHQTFNEFNLFYPQKFEGKTLFFNEQVDTLSKEIANEVNPRSRVIVASSMTLAEKAPEELYLIEEQMIDMTPYGGVCRRAGATVPYLVSPRMDEIIKYGLPNYIFYDEAHHSVSDRMLLLIRDKLWKICDILGKPRIKLLGFTATGYREDGIDLGNLYQAISIQRSVKWAQDQGYLAPVREIVNVHAALKDEKVLVKDTENWCETFLRGWRERGEDRPTIGYMNSVEDSVELTKYFIENGVPSAHIDSKICILPDGSTNDVESRYVIYEGFLNGKIKCLFNYSVILEGTNLPPASCMIWARRSENIQLATQAIGRMLRLFSGSENLPPKEDVILLNFVGKDFTIMSSGILGGIKVDPLTGRIDRTELDEEVETTVERDLRDLDKDLIRSDGVVYSAGKLIRKTGTAWYTDDRTGVRTLPVTTTDSLVIIPPYYTLANKIQHLLDTKTFDKRDEELLYYALTFYSSYTLWHHKDKARTRDFVYYNESFERLLDYSIVYIYEITQSPINSFIRRKSRKVEDPASAKSIGLMRTLALRYKVDISDVPFTKWDVSDMITYMISYRGDVIFSVLEIYKSVKGFLDG